MLACSTSENALTVPPDLKIYIATHSHAPRNLIDEGYVAIHGGKQISKLELGLIGDDTGIHISNLNRYLNECTVLYWALMNRTSEYVGLVHYRRYFSAKKTSTRVDGHEVAHSSDFTEITNGAFDIITAAPFRYNDPGSGRLISLEENYYGAHVGWDLLSTRKAIEALSPPYLQAFDFVMRGNLFIPYNMFVAKATLINEYGGWLFPVLFELNKTIPYETYDSAYQQRAVSFISERLFNVWLIENRSRFKMGYRDIVFFDELKGHAE